MNVPDTRVCRAVNHHNVRSYEPTTFWPIHGDYLAELNKRCGQADVVLVRLYADMTRHRAELPALAVDNNRGGGTTSEQQASWNPHCLRPRWLTALARLRGLSLQHRVRRKCCVILSFICIFYWSCKSYSIPMLAR
jgi:hypothetical protein